MDWHLDQVTAKVLFFLSLLQWLYGMTITIYLYGRKVCRDSDDDDDDEEVLDEDESNPYLQYQRQQRAKQRTSS